MNMGNTNNGVLVSSKLLLIKNWLLNTKSNSFEATIDIFNMYVKGGFGSSYDTRMQTIFNIAKPGIRSEYFRGNSSTHERFVEKWDTTPEAISNQAASNFIKALMPLSEKSINLEYTRLREEILNLPGDSANKVLNEISALEKEATFNIQEFFSSKKSNFNEMIFNTAKDFLDYGNAVLLTEININKKGKSNFFFRHLDFTNTYFWREKERESFAVLNVRRQYNFLLKRDYPNYLPSIDAKTLQIQQVQKDVFRIYVTRDYIDDNIINIQEIIDYFKIPMSSILEDKVFEFVIVDSMIIGFRSFFYNPITIATIGNFENHYGYGDGLSSLGGVVMANFASGSQYLTVQKLNSSPMVVRDDTLIDAVEGNTAANKGLMAESQIDFSPGGITKIGNSSQNNPTLGIQDMIQPLTTPHQQLNVFIELGMNAQKIISDCYEAGTMNMGSEIPNETAMAASARISQKIRNFTSRSEIFCQYILYQIIILFNNTIKSDNKNKLILIMNKFNLTTIIALKDDNDFLSPKIVSYVTEAKKQLDMMNLQNEIQIMAGLAQMGEAFDEEEMIALKEKAKRIFG